MLIERIPYCDPFVICSYFANKIGTTFLDSARVTAGSGKYSFLAIDPFQILAYKNNAVTINNILLEKTNPFLVLQEELLKYPLLKIKDLPSFQTGVAGFFGYDLKNHLEVLPKIEQDDMEFPDLFLGFYDLVIAFDHTTKECFAMSSGYPEKNREKQALRAAKRLSFIIKEIQNINSLHQNNSLNGLFTKNVTITKESITSNFTKESYMRAVEKTINYILAGDIFEANISQRFQAHISPKLEPIELFRRIRTINPAPFAAFINANDTHIVSSSPERFLKLTDNIVETYPIKGTRPRSLDLEIDKKLGEELQQSEKDWAENVMIVDLMRNDLSKVCKDHSVHVPKLCELESFATVHHLVSKVTGELKSGKNAIDLLKATFPGGSITGAPKVRTMEIIAEIEQIKRGPYCGSIGYISFNGDMDTSIVIRTYAIKNNTVTFQAGGAIVLDSSPAEEYQETLDKALALKNALCNTV